MERIKRKETFRLKDSEVVVLQLTKKLFVLRDWFSYNLDNNLTFEDVTARLSLAEKNQEEFPDVFWELINA
jgi:site-specific recombinase XerD